MPIPNFGFDGHDCSGGGVLGVANVVDDFVAQEVINRITYAARHNVTSRRKMPLLLMVFRMSGHLVLLFKEPRWNSRGF
jgi:hypothetical protein